MATNFTNKYMQVFQDYNEFSEHSADYVRGEDHIAFLIEENEVIYWLYLEQVWRPLNVRTTTTGQLEDGRTKVAVRLEYIEGGQKYTSVPNIPDPERITSMSHFLEDYPDIEEVNVSGTVNLTDLSSAFAGSKIKDFSMLDTSNVNDFSHMLENTNNITSVSITSNITNNLNIYNIIENSNVKELVINFPKVVDDINFINWQLYQFAFVKLDKLIIKLNDNYSENYNDSYIDLATIENDNYIKYIETNFNIKINDRSTSNDDICEIHTNSLKLDRAGANNSKTFNIYANYIHLILHNESKEKIYLYNKTTIANISDHTANPGFKFGYGINYNNNEFSFDINYIETFGNFWFTTPIVDDAFYAKYAQYNTPISIFQYKTTFEEVADVNISSEVDSNLLYVDWNNIDFDKSAISIEIYNNIDAYVFGKDDLFAKYIIDNSTILENDNNITYPYITVSGEYYNYELDLPNYDNYRISGNYTTDYNIKYSLMFKDINIYFNNRNLQCYYTRQNFSNDKNIKLYNCSGILLNFDDYTDNYIIESLIDNNIFNSYLRLDVSSYVYYRNGRILIQYIDNVKLNICKGTLLCIYYNWFKNSNINNYIDIKEDSKLVYGQLVSMKDHWHLNTLDDVYVNCDDDVYINYFDGYVENSNIGDGSPFTFAKNWFGNINIRLSPYSAGINRSTYINYTEHIDINKVCKSNINSNQSEILTYLHLDNESLINLIVKLIDNSEETINTIYMYRSQANIIGEDNIAGAVAKNYEIAIIEN